MQAKHGLGPTARFRFPKGWWGQLLGDSALGPSVVTHLSLSVLGLWLLGFACTVCPLQTRVTRRGAGVIRSGATWSGASEGGGVWLACNLRAPLHPADIEGTLPPAPVVSLHADVGSSSCCCHTRVLRDRNSWAQGACGRQRLCREKTDRACKKPPRREEG